MGEHEHEHEPECPSAKDLRHACICPTLHAAMERARIAERVGLGPLWRGGVAEVERDTRERIEALLVSEGYEAAAFVVAGMRPDGRAGHRDPDPGFPPHEHAGDAHDPNHCVWTRADGERCMAPVPREIRTGMFRLVRHADPSGISGTGIVAEGCEFSDGVVALRWLEVTEGPSADRGVRPTTTIHESIASVEALHGHNGATTIEWGVDG